MVSFFTPARTVLMISDDALFIYSISGKGIKMVEAIPWSAENFEQNVALIISKECGGKPVLILNDMVEQHYRKEKIPKVGALDKQNVVKRKLQVSFPNYPVRAALPLKEKIKKTDSSLGAGVYIFAAVPASEAFNKTMAAATRSLVSIAGFCLLPVESSDMIKRLSDKIVPKTERHAKWSVFIGQHQGGELRQIVTKDGELALTRMTPIVDNDNDRLLWANEVHQEFQATMSYLSRFGFNPNDGLNVFLIADPACGDIVSGLVEDDCNFYSVTNEEAAKHLKLPAISCDTSFHADMLHVGWIGKKSRFILPMKAKQIDTVSKPRQVASLASVLLLIGAALLGYQLVNYTDKLEEVRSDIDGAERRHALLKFQLDKEIKRKKDLGFDIQLIQVALSVHDQLERNQIDGLKLFYGIGRGLGRDLRIDRIEVARGRPRVGQRLLGGGAKPPLFVAHMQMTFPSDSDTIKGNNEVRELQNRLQTIFPDHVVRVSKFLEDFEYSEELVLEDGDVETASTKQDFVAELSIEGPEVE